METMMWYESIGRLVLAAACGLMLGIEREDAAKPAGMRTFALVALGAAGFSIVTMNFYTRGDIGEAGGVDPMRLISGLIGGIGFLGAGSIMQSRGEVHGLTTAAGLWVCGAIGLAAGIGQYSIALMLTAFSFLILRLLLRVKPDEHKNATGDADADAEATADKSSGG